MGIFVLEASARMPASRRAVTAAATAATLGRVGSRRERSYKFGAFFCQFE